MTQPRGAGVVIVGGRWPRLGGGDGPAAAGGGGLGTVVAMVLLTRIPDQLNVVELVTADSPLGMDDMDTVLKRPLTGGLHRPDRVGDWVNVWCPADAVAIGRPLRGDWGDRLTEVITNNPKDRAHSIEEDLADRRVADAIGAALR